MMYENKKYNPVMSGLRPDITDYYVFQKLFFQFVLLRLVTLVIIL